jgi:hypothetical protein
MEEEVGTIPSSKRLELWTMFAFTVPCTPDRGLFDLRLIPSFRWPRDRHLLVQTNVDWGLPGDELPGLI